MLSKTMYAALNKHMNTELFSAYLYLNMAAAANEMGFKGAPTGSMSSTRRRWFTS